MEAPYASTRFKFDAVWPYRLSEAGVREQVVPRREDLYPAAGKAVAVDLEPEPRPWQRPEHGIIVHSITTARLAGYEGDGTGAVIADIWLEGNNGNWLDEELRARSLGSC